MSKFADTLVSWQRQHGRHDLPWQQTRDPYRVWLSEIMLQQTQVDTVIPYYDRFLQHFPDVASLAAAPQDAVLAQWSGLGYYARARNLHKAAQIVMAQHGGQFPQTAAGLVELPGIGRSTAAAIASFCFGERAAILDGNVKRVLCRHRGVDGFPGERAVENHLWALADALLPAEGIDTYTQALMDLGATLCTRSRPTCAICPVAADCVARETGRQAELPAARPRKPVPQRALDVLVLRARGRVLMERRPASGIWGGLYSLPECGEGESPLACAQRRFGIAAADATALPPLRHSFTHFTLTLTPWLIELPKLPRMASDDSLYWADADTLPSLGLPAPIKRLLADVPALLES
ncbi:MAG: A/G-specific adenine glycosylase [Moraxellaceae bacterium]|nr:A/G-specific adenine glycosylase [Moraxellaceae bacterium]